MGSDARRDRLAELLGPVVVAHGLDLEDVTITPAGRRSLVRIVVDRDGGVTLDDVAEVSQAVSKELDSSDLLGKGPYVLEISSPGVDRPLTEPRHWKRARGRLVKADLRDGSSTEGRITGADEAGVELDGTRRIAFGDLARGRVQVEFNRGDAGPEGLDELEDGIESDFDETDGDDD
jgi:ribosome maturation factor RimP